MVFVLRLELAVEIGEDAISLVLAQEVETALETGARLRQLFPQSMHASTGDMGPLEGVLEFLVQGGVKLLGCLRVERDLCCDSCREV